MTLCSECEIDEATQGPLCEECHAEARQEALDNALLRFQDAGLPLSRSHRSETWSEDESDSGAIHEGTSVVRGWNSLRRASPALHAGDVDLIWLEGYEVGRGWDDEPVVIPERELSRYRFPRGGYRTFAKLPLAKTPEELRNLGWVEVPTMQVVD